MWLFSPPCSARQRTSREPSRGFRPTLEALEDRWCPAGGIFEWADPEGSSAMAVAVQPDGKTVIAGTVPQGSRLGYSSIFVQRLNRDGSVDTTFNGSGSLTIQVGAVGSPTDVALQPDGKIVIAGGVTTNNGDHQFLVARVNANGTMDKTFGSKGLWVYTGSWVTALAILTDPVHPTTVTGIVAAAKAVTGFEAIKLTPAGVPDRTFGSGGFAVFPNLTGPAQSVAVAPSGEIYLAGSVNTVGCLAAVTPSGALDTAFGNGTGYVQADPMGHEESGFNDVAVQTMTVGGQTVSRVLAAGYIVTANYAAGFVAAYTLGGAVDTSFGNGGAFIYANRPGLESTEFFSLALEADGSIVVGGEHSLSDGTSEGVFGHLTAAGTADTSFGTAGTGFVFVPYGKRAKIWGVAVDPSDGGIVVCGVTLPVGTGPGQDFVARFTGPG